jgi:hypothetical protein
MAEIQERAKDRIGPRRRRNLRQQEGPVLSDDEWAQRFAQTEPTYPDPEDPTGLNGPARALEWRIKSRGGYGAEFVDFMFRVMRGKEPGSAGAEGLKYRMGAWDRLTNRGWGKPPIRIESRHESHHVLDLSAIATLPEEAQRKLLEAVQFLRSVRLLNAPRPGGMPMPANGQPPAVEISATPVREDGNAEPDGATKGTQGGDDERLRPS